MLWKGENPCWVGPLPGKRRPERPFDAITGRFVSKVLLKAYPLVSPRPFGGRGGGGEGGLNRCRFSQSIPTFACPHPNPLPEGEGDFLA